MYKHEAPNACITIYNTKHAGYMQKKVTVQNTEGSTLPVPISHNTSHWTYQSLVPDLLQINILHNWNKQKTRFKFDSPQLLTLQQS